MPQYMKTKDPLSYKVIGCAYEKALIYELQSKGLSVASQVPIEMSYKGINIGEGLRLDILIENSLIVELKSVEELRPIHYKQLLTYLKLTNKHTGLLINFNVNDFRDGIKRVINGY